LRVRQPDAAFGCKFLRAFRQPAPVVADGDVQHTVRARSLNPDAPALCARRDAVAHGVFNERLENHIGHAGIEGLRVDLHLHS